MSPAAPFVRAVVVTTGRTEFLVHALTALSSQEHSIDAWHVVVVGDASVADAIPDDIDIPVTPVKATSFGEAVTALLADIESEDREWLWLLHDDCAPENRALSALVAASRKRRQAGVLGSAVARWDDGARLVNAGVTVSKFGARRIGVVDADDLDQGQHQGREDVLAVSLVGALVRRELWERLDGTDPATGRFGDSVDFCRRAWRAGSDVIVVPAARIRHAQSTLYGRTAPSQRGTDHRGTHAVRRASEWYHAAAWAPVWGVPLVLLLATFSTLLRAIFRLVSFDVRLLSSEMRVPVYLALRIPWLAHSRRRIAAAGTSGSERRLLARALDVARHIRSRELGAYEAWRAANRPTDVQRRELKQIAIRRRWTLLALLAVLGAISFAQYGTWLAPILDGAMLTGDTLGATNVSLAELWARTTTGWDDAGTGVGALDGTWAAAMLPLALFPGGLATGLGLLLTFAPLIAGVAAWFAAGAATRAVTARMLAAIAWSVWPPFLQAVVDGRVGAIVAHILLPFFVLALVRSVSAQRRDRLGAGEEFPHTRVGSTGMGAIAAILLAVIGAVVPVLVAPLVVGCVAVAIFAHGRRRIPATVPLPAIVAAGPAIVAAVTSGNWIEILAREPGPALVSEPTSTWSLLLGVVQDPPAWPAATEAANVVLTYLPGVAIVAVALTSLLGRVGGGVARAGWGVAAVGLAVATLSQATIVAPAGLDGSPAANGWPGAGLSLMALGLIGAALAGTGKGPSAAEDAATIEATGELATERRMARFAASGATVIVALILTVQVVATIWPGREAGGDVHPARTEVLPLVATLEQRSDPATRVLVLDGTAENVTYTVLARDGSTALLGRGFLAADGSVRPFGVPPLEAHTVSEDVARIAGAAEDAAAGLRDWGIGVVVIAPGADSLETGALRSPGLSLIGASDIGITLRVSPEASAERADLAARAWIEAEDVSPQSLDSTPTRIDVEVVAGAEDRIVVIATEADDRWTATLDGRSLDAVESNGRVAFALGPAGGNLVVSFHDRGYQWWWWATVAAFVWILANAIPVRDRRFTQVAP